MKNTIEDTLDEALDALRNGKEIQDILKEYPGSAEELAPLLKCAKALTDAPTPQTESDTSGLMRIIAKIAAEEREERRSLLRFTPKRRFLRVAASVALLFFLGWGSVNASSNAVPGDWFYPIKLLTENVKFLLSVNEEDKVELRITYSAERLKELVRKYNSGKGVDKELLRRMLDEAKAALEDANKLSGHTQPIVSGRISNLNHLQLNTLKEIEKKASPNDKRILERYIRKCGEMTKCCMMMNRRSDGKFPSGAWESFRPQRNRKDGESNKMMKRCPMMNDMN